LGYPGEFTHAMPYAEANSQVCALLGDLSMGAFLIHAYLVLAHPLTRPHINAMVDGRISEEDARALYPLWYARIRGASARGK